MGTIRSVNITGACERIHALKQMERPAGILAGTPAAERCATLILYAEKESSVLVDRSPTRFALEKAHHAYFPRSTAPHHQPRAAARCSTLH